MADDADTDALLGRLDRLVATAKTLGLRDRRLLLSLQADLRAVRTDLHTRRDSTAQKLNMAGARSKAVSAYSRVAFLGRSSAPGPTNT